MARQSRVANLNHAMYDSYENRFSLFHIELEKPLRLLSWLLHGLLIPTHIHESPCPEEGSVGGFCDRIEG